MSFVHSGLSAPQLETKGRDKLQPEPLSQKTATCWPQDSSRLFLPGGFVSVTHWKGDLFNSRDRRPGPGSSEQLFLFLCKIFMYTASSSDNYKPFLFQLQACKPLGSKVSNFCLLQRVPMLGPYWVEDCLRLRDLWMAGSEIELRFPCAIYNASDPSSHCLSVICCCVTNHPKPHPSKQRCYCSWVFRPGVWTGLGGAALLLCLLLAGILTWPASGELGWKVQEDITQVSRTSLCLLRPLSLHIVSPLVHYRSLIFFTTNYGSCLPLVKAEGSRSWQASYTVWLLLCSVDQGKWRDSQDLQGREVDPTSWWAEQHVHQGRNGWWPSLETNHDLGSPTDAAFFLFPVGSWANREAQVCADPKEKKEKKNALQHWPEATVILPWLSSWLRRLYLSIRREAFVLGGMCEVQGSSLGNYSAHFTIICF